MELAGRCTSGGAVMRKVREMAPDIVILDLHLKDVRAIEIVKQLMQKGVPVVLLAQSAMHDEILEALRAGVQGVVLKDMPLALVMQCIRKVAQGGEWIEKVSTGKILQRLIKGADTEREYLRRLTAREAEVVKLACLGKRNTEIAGELNLSVSTIKIHLHKVFEKLAVRNRSELILWAREHGVL